VLPVEIKLHCAVAAAHSIKISLSSLLYCIQL